MRFKNSNDAIRNQCPNMMIYEDDFDSNRVREDCVNDTAYLLYLMGSQRTLFSSQSIPLHSYSIMIILEVMIECIQYKYALR